jgi:hypothetical protein
VSETNLDKPTATSPTLSPAVMIGLRLLKIAFVYLAFQLTVIFIGRYYFFSNSKSSAAIYQFFARTEDFTPALRDLKAFYEVPVDGVEYSQVFAVYLLILAFLSLYFMALCAGIFAGLFKNIHWRELGWRDYGLFSLMFGAGLWTFQVFLWGPIDYENMFYQDYITSMCSLLPAGQLSFLVPLVAYFTMGGAIGKKA